MKAFIKLSELKTLTFKYLSRNFLPIRKNQTKTKQENKNETSYIYPASHLLRATLNKTRIKLAGQVYPRQVTMVINHGEWADLIRIHQKKACIKRENISKEARLLMWNLPISIHQN